WADQVALDAAADAIDSVLKADPAYSGLFVDARGHRLVAYGTAAFAPTRWSGALALMPAGESLAFAQAQLSAAQVSVLSTYVSSRVKAGLAATRWGLESMGGPFQVSMQPGSALPAADATHLRRFGSRSLVVHTSAPRSSGRYDDTSPFY